MTESEKRMHRCAFTGHRPEKLTESKEVVCERLQAAIEQAYADGFNVFITGMARGVDLWAADIVLNLRQRNNDVKLICAVPFEGFEARWSEDNRREYARIIEQSDLVRYICPHYSKPCFQIRKSEFILSLCEQLIGSLGAQQKSLIDRCTANVYRHYQQGNYMGIPPTLQDFREELLRQPEPEAKEVALAIELFTDGSLNTFAKQTNVDTSNSLLCYDILDLGKQLLPIGMLVVLDSILNRVTRNREKGISTYIVIDEIYLLFQHEYSANFLFTLWKRVRKYGANCTGITQNVDDLLQSHTARTMLANSEFIVMLNQASTDRIELAKLLGISETQLSYITNVNAGCGLLKVGSALVPFTDDFPKDTTMYKLMSTKPGETAT